MGQWFRIAIGVIAIIGAISLLPTPTVALSRVLLATMMFVATCVHLLVIGGSQLTEVPRTAAIQACAGYCAQQPLRAGQRKYSWQGPPAAPAAKPPAMTAPGWTVSLATEHSDGSCGLKLPLVRLPMAVSRALFPQVGGQHAARGRGAFHPCAEIAPIEPQAAAARSSLCVSGDVRTRPASHALQ